MFNALARAAEEAGAAETHNPLLPELPDLVYGSLVFLILVVFFTVKVLPSLNKTLDERAALIEGGISKAANAQAEANAALEEYKKQLADARAEAARIRE
jgi:F-type H+-transporting ATPase subunit b